MNILVSRWGLNGTDRLFKVIPARVVTARPSICQQIDMQPITRLYLKIFAGIGIVILLLWALQYNPRIGEINAMLMRDPELAGFPWRFHVLDIEGKIAYLSTPRSPEVSVLKFLYIAWPELEGKDPDDPEVIKAQKELARVQGKAREKVLVQPDIEWRLHRKWFSSHGIVLMGNP